MEPIISLTERLKQIVPGLQVPGAAATKTVLNAPKGAAKRIPVVGPMIDMGLATYDVTQGSDPIRAYTRMATEMAGGALGAGAAGMLALPTGPGAAAAGFAGYMGGSAAAGAGYDALFPEGIRVGSLDGKRSIGNMNDTSYDLSTPEGAAGFDKARKAALEVQTDKGIVPGQLPSDYKEAEAAAFRAAAKAGDPQTPEIRQITAATGTDTSTSRRDDPRNADYISARSALTPESSAADIKSVEDAGMAAWAKANPGLVAEAVRRGSKQAGYDVLEPIAFGAAAEPEGKELTEADMASYDNLETFKPSEMKAGDRQDPIAGRDNILNSYFPGARAPYSEEAFGAKLQDAQVFEGGINPNAAQIAEVDPQEFLRSRIRPGIR